MRAQFFLFVKIVNFLHNFLIFDIISICNKIDIEIVSVSILFEILLIILPVDIDRNGTFVDLVFNGEKKRTLYIANDKLYNNVCIRMQL